MKLQLVQVQVVHLDLGGVVKRDPQLLRETPKECHQLEPVIPNRPLHLQEVYGYQLTLLVRRQ